MAESTLTLKMSDLTGEAGSFLGWGRDSARWSARKQEDVREVVASALRKFYFQATVHPKDPPHEWTFLKPVARLHLVDGVNEIPLPEDFGGFDGLATIALTGSSGGYWPINQYPEEQLRGLHAAVDSSSGRPYAYADTPRKPTPNGSSRCSLLVYPTPDENYQFEVPYLILPSYLTEQAPYPYGGAGHAETLKAGVRAAAELYEDDEAGEQTNNYLQCLAASILYDRRHQPKTLGINTDLSDGMYSRRRWPDGLWSPYGIGALGIAEYT